MIHFQHLNRRKYFAIADFLCVVLAVSLAFFVRTKIPLPVFAGLLPVSPPAGFQSFWYPAVMLGFIFVFMQYAFGVYDLWHSSRAANWIQRVLPANLAMIAAAFSYLYLSQNFHFPRSLLLVLFLLNYILTVCWRVIYFTATLKDTSDILLVGQWSAVSKLLEELSTPPFSSNARVLCVFVPEYTQDIPPEPRRDFLVLPLSDFELYTSKYPCASVILAPSDSFQQKAFNCVLSAARRGISIYVIPTIYEILLGRLQHLRINDLPLLELRLSPPHTAGLFVKRAFDLFGSAALLFVLFVPMLFLAALVKLTSPGPALYSQIRVGYLGKQFKIVKFRTMGVDAEINSGAVFASKGDSRVTRLGRVLRATRADELPQLWNILKGDMSFVGPRPERPVFVSEFGNRIEGYNERHSVKPGVTGLAQVSGSYSTSAEVKLKYDLAYISNQNVLFDLQILFRTLKIVFSRSGI